MKRFINPVFAVLITILCFSTKGNAQQSKIDSVFWLLNKCIDRLDTNSIQQANNILITTSVSDYQANRIDSFASVLIKKWDKEEGPHTIQLAMFYNYISSDAPHAIEYGKRQVEKYERLRTPIATSFKTDYLSLLRFPFRNTNRLEEGIHYFTDKLNEYKIRNDSTGISLCYFVLSGFFMISGIPDIAIYNIKKSCSYKDTLQDKQTWVNNIGVLGHYYLQLENKAECLKYSGIALREQMIQKSGFSFTSLIMARMMILSNEPDSAAYYINIAKQDTLNYRPDKQTSLLQNEAYYKIYIGELSDAEALIDECWQLINENNISVNSRAGIIAPDYYLALIRIKQNKPEEAITLLEKDIVRLLNNRIDILRDYKLMAELYRKIGRNDKSAETYTIYLAKQDSLLKEQSKYRSFSFEAEQQMSEKEASIANLESENKIASMTRNFVAAGFLVALFFGVFIYRQRNRISKEKKRSEELLLNILPAEAAEELKSTGKSKAKAYTLVTVMFTDFADFTKVSEKVSAELLVDEIHQCFSAFDRIIEKYKIEKIKTIGDAYLCASGLPVSNYTHAIDMINCAIEIRNFMSNRKEEKMSRGEIPFEIRIGIHTGPLVAGIVGIKKYAYDIWGDTVNIAARIEQNSEEGKVNISGATYELVKNKFKCEHRGKIQAKNKGEIDMYFVGEPVS